MLIINDFTRNWSLALAWQDYAMSIGYDVDSASQLAWRMIAD